MVFRRSNNSGRGNFRFRSRRFKPLGTDRKAKPTQRYEWGEFFNEGRDLLPTIGGAGQTSLSYTRLASTRTIGDASTGPGVALISAVRHIDVGGVVMDWTVAPSSAIDGEDDPSLIFEGKMYCMVGLITDRSDGSDPPVPGSINSWDPFQTSTPTAVVSDIGGTPLATTLDTDRPTRLLWQRTFAMDFHSRVIQNQGEGSLYVPNDQRVQTSPPTLNKRLRVRLSDDMGLYFFCAYRASLPFSSLIAPSADHFIRGSIYYRYAF